MFVYGRDACFNCVRTFSFYCSLSAALWYNKSTKAFYPIQLNLFTGVSTHVLQDSYFQTKDCIDQKKSSSVRVFNEVLVVEEYDTSERKSKKRKSSVYKYPLAPTA